jgi:citrate synthase
MLIGKQSRAVSSICTADAANITVRDRDLCGDLMGRMTFTEYFYLLVTAREPSDDQRDFLDLMLIAIAEHGMTPTAAAARMTYDADPQSLQSAVAAGILGCGTVVLGTSGLCASLLVDAQRRIDEGETVEAVTAEIATSTRASGGKMPGFGHPLHRTVDPRAQRIFELAASRGVAGRYVALARAFEGAVAGAWGKPLPMNVSMPTAAVMLDLDFPAAMVKAIPLLARTGGILAHLAEEQESQIGFLMASHAEAAISYEPGPRQD